MSKEDNTFDFRVQDRLRKECEGLRPMFRDSLKNQLLLDMIAYCSQGSQEDAVLNLQTTRRFARDYDVTMTRLLLPASTVGWDFFGDYFHYGQWFVFEFWKKCFIQTKVAVQKEEALPRESWHVVMLREYGRFTNSHNFTNLNAFDTEARIAKESLKNASDNLNNTYKALMERN